MVGTVRISNRRSEKTTFWIVDAQSVKNTDTSEHKGYDSDKEISGIKRHIAVDTQGFPDAIAVTTAGVAYRKGSIGSFYPSQEIAVGRRSIFGPMAPIEKQPFVDGVTEIVERSFELA